MASTIEELDKRQTVLEVRQKTLETEQQPLAQGHADIRERQTRVEETNKRILEQLAFIRTERSMSCQRDFWSYLFSCRFQALLLALHHLPQPIQVWKRD